MAPLPLADQSFPPRRRFDDVEHRICGIGHLFIGKIHACTEPDIDATRHDPEIDMRCHGATASSNNCAGFDGPKPVSPALEITTRPSPASKILVDGLVLPIGGVFVTASGSCRPHLHLWGNATQNT